MQWFKSRLIFRVFFSTFFPTLILVLAFFPVYQSSQKASIANQQVANSYAIIADANQLTQLIVDAQTGVRGYLLTSDDAFLESFYQADPAFKSLLEQMLVKQLTEQQQSLLQEIRDDFTEWKQKVAQVQVRLVRSGALTSEDSSTTEGKQRIDALKQLASQLVAIEHTRLQEREEQSKTAAEKTKSFLLISACFCLALAFVLASFTAFYTSSSLTLITRVARAFAAGDLKQRASTEGRDEFSILGAVFNQLAEQLQQMVQLEQQQSQQLHLQVEKLVKARIEDARQLKQVGELLQSCQDQSEAADVVRISCQKIFEGSSGALFLAGGTDFKLASCWGSTSQPEYFSAESCWAIRRGKPHFFDSNDTALRCNHLEQYSGPTLCIPLLARGDLVGMLSIEPSLDGTSATNWLEENQEAAANLAEQLALALMNIKLRDSLQQQSVRDALTGLYNRRQMDSSFAELFEKAVREKTALSVLLIDIDHFKKLNDVYGHAVGDDALKLLSTLLQDMFRGSDLACRYGGEEFVVLLPGANSVAALSRAEELRLRCQDMKFQVDGQLLSFTLSIGVAALKEGINQADELLKSADEALYTAKNKGRNRVEAAV